MLFDKWYSLEEANRMLPIVREELAYLQIIQHQFRSTYSQLQATKKGNVEKIMLIKDDVFMLEATLDFLRIEAEGLLRQLKQQHIYIKSISLGLVDFPAKLNNLTVYLCWKQGEEFISYYHEVSASYINRKKISAIDVDNLGG